MPPISWPVMRLWLLFIGAGLLFYPLSWVIDGAKAWYWSSIGLSLLTSLGTILVSVFVLNDLKKFRAVSDKSGSSYIAGLGATLVFYVVVGLAVGNLVFMLGGSTLTILGWLVVAICALSGLIVIILAYRSRTKESESSAPE